jgi:hypothetical protein
MSLSAEVNAVVSFKDVGKSDILAGEGVGAYGSLTLKRTVNDVTYTFKGTETTFKNLKGLNGSVLTIAKPFGPVTAAAGLELGPVRRLNAQLKGKFSYEKGRSLELNAQWREATGAWLLTTTAQPHKAHKLTSAYNTANQALVATYSADIKGFTLAPVYNFKTQAKGVALSHKVQGGTLKASYALDSRTAGLEFNCKPYKATISTRFTDKGASNPTLTFMFNREIELGSRTPKRNDITPVGQKVPEVRRDIALDTKLRELDALYEPKLAAARAKKDKHDAQAKSH